MTSEPNEKATEKQSYETPEIRVLGDIEKLTQGGGFLPSNYDSLGFDWIGAGQGGS